MELNMELVANWAATYAVRVAGALLVLVIGRWLARRLADILERLMEKRGVEETLVRFLANLLYYALVVMVLIAAVGQLGVNTASFLTVVGAAGLAVGLALKDSLSNFAAGVMLILFRPFKAGDWITAAGLTARVEKISIFHTIFCTGDNQEVIVPNNRIIGDTITNINARDTRRVDLVVGISYDDNIGRAREILTGLLASDSRILKEPAPVVAAAELADSSINLNVRPWVNTPDYWAVRFDLIEAIKDSFDKAGITIPYPQRDVHLVTEKVQPG